MDNITITFSDGSIIDNLSTEDFINYNCKDKISEKEIKALEKHLSEVTISQADNHVLYELTHQKIDNYVSNESYTKFQLHGKYDMFGIDKNQVYTRNINNKIQLDNIIVRFFPYYEANYIIDKNIFDNMSTVSISRDDREPHIINNPKLFDYYTKNMHTMFILCRESDYNKIHIDNEKVKIILEDGTELNNVNNRYFRNYECEDVIEKEVLQNNMANIILQYENGKQRTYKNQTIDSYQIVNGHTLFHFSDMNEIEVIKENIVDIQRSILKFYNIFMKNTDINVSN